MEQRFRIVSDDDGHSYVIPVARWDEFDEMLEHLDDDFEMPEWVTFIDNPSSITFTDWREEY